MTELHNQPTNDNLPQEECLRKVPLAIVGIGCMFPDARDKQSFWRVLRTGKDCIRELPDTHWKAADYYDADHSSPDRVYAKRGGFLEPYNFDPTEFSFPPNALEATDSSQLLALVCAKAALEDAGYGANGRPVPKETTGVILGVTGTQEIAISLGARLGHPHWRRALRAAGVDDETADKVVKGISDSYVSWQENSFPGLLGNVVAGRVANKMDLHGTNCVIDAACASSLAALNLAMAELQSGRADLMLTGGVDTINDIFMFTCFSKTPALSGSGRISPFSADADGTLLGEGVGIIALKRLTDAERDGDRIYAVIKGLGSSSDGNSGAIYAPDAAGQARSLERAYRDAQVSPDTISCVEAHGTGTKVGDVVEFNALNQVYGTNNGLQYCALGTVKSQIGHTKASAGAASLCKAAFSLYHKVLLPTINIKEPNPKMDLAHSAFYLNTETRPWLSSSLHPRRAALSSFGFGGSNFHVVLEEAQPERTAPAWDGSLHILAFCAPNRAELMQEIKGALEWKVDEFAYRASLNRRKFVESYAQEGEEQSRPWRFTAVTDREGYAVLLSQVLEALEKESRLPEGCYLGTPETDPGALGFLFPGQGSQYLGMGREWSAIFPQALDLLETADSALDESQSPARRIFPIPSFEQSVQEQQAKDLTDTRAAQPALGFMEACAAHLLEYFGVTPDAAAGHSYGELVALHACGCLSASQLFILSGLRGRLMAQGDGGRGAMMAVAAPAEDVMALVKEVGAGVVPANFNHPKQTVVSGLKEKVDELKALCQERKITARPLAVSAAFHSPLMQEACAPFAQALQEVEFGQAQFPVYANYSADLYPEKADDKREMLARQLVNPVRFTEILEKMYAQGIRTFVEVGPKNVLAGLVKHTLEGRPHHMVVLDGRKGGGELKALACALAELVALGIPVELDRWEESPAAPRAKKMIVPICGANYRSPHGKSTVPPADPHQPVEGYQPAPPIRRPAVSEAGSQPQVRTVVKTIVKTVERPSEGKQMDHTPQQPTTPGNPAMLAQAFRTIQEGLTAMQYLQQQTAQAHMRFLETQEQIQKSFHELVAQQQMLAQSGLNGQTLPAVPWPELPASPALSAPSLSAYPQPQAPAVYPASCQAPQISLPAAPAPCQPVPAPVVEAPHAVMAAQPLNIPPMPQPAPANTRAAFNDVAAVVLSVVADKTGYPVDTLSLDMDLEGDLGIDSIKRVEILAAVEEKLPGLTSITPDEIGSLHTLKQVTERLQSGSGTSSAPHTPAPQVLKPAAPQSADIAPTVLEIVADKTGYPVDTLSLDMDLESDLGIDSIKRVEILAAVEDKIPGARSIGPDEIGSLHTLKQVVERLNAGKSQGEAAGAPAAPADMAATVLEIVADKTGYPVDTLNLDMDLEGDLGIDSIKRVEILAAVEDKLPGAQSIGPDEIGSLHTLRQVVERLSANFSRGGSGEGIPAPQAISAPSADCAPLTPEDLLDWPVSQRRVFSLETSLAPQNGKISWQDKTCLLADDGHYAPQLAPLLQQAGAKTVLLPWKDLAHEISAYLSSHPQEVQAFIMFFHSNFEMADGTDGCLNDLEQAFLALQAFTPVLASQQDRAAFITVSAADGLFGQSGKGFNPVDLGVHGLVKAAMREYPQALCRSLDLMPADAEGQSWTHAEAAQALMRELTCRESNDIALRPGMRLGATLEEAPLNAQDGSKGACKMRPMRSIPQDGLVVISGGARGVTAQCALTLARTLHPSFLLLGRSPYPEQESASTLSAVSDAEIKAALYKEAGAQGLKVTPAQLNRQCKSIRANREVMATLNGLRELGCRVKYVSIDVRDQEQVARAVAEARREFGPVYGVIHAAGVLADKLIADKTREQFHSVVSTKIAGLNSLRLALKADSDPLCFFVCFSSVTARFGRPGQCDYAVANEIMNKTLQQMRFQFPEARMSSLGWGPWDGGMVDDGLRKEFAKIGAELIALDKGSNTLVADILRGTPDETEMIIGSGFNLPHVDPQASLLQEYTLSETDFPVLKDHAFQGSCVVPMALIAELAVESSLRTYPGWILAGLTDFECHQKLSLAPQSSIKAQMCLTRQLFSSSMMKLELAFCCDGDIYATLTVILCRRQDMPCCNASDASPALPLPPEAQELAQEAERAPQSLTTVDEAYRHYLFHGPALQAVQAINVLNEQGVVLHVRDTRDTAIWGAEAQGILSPLILDCALQAGLIWSGARREMGSLPCKTGCLRLMVPRLPQELDLILKVRKAKGALLLGSIYFAHQGHLLAIWHNVQWMLSPTLNAAFQDNLQG